MSPMETTVPIASWTCGGLPTARTTFSSMIGIVTIARGHIIVSPSRSGSQSQSLHHHQWARMRHKHEGIALPWDGMLAPHTRGNLLFATSQAYHPLTTAILAPRGGWSYGKMVAVSSKDMGIKRIRPRQVMSIVATIRAEWVGIFAMVECGDQVMQRRFLGSPAHSHRTVI